MFKIDIASSFKEIANYKDGILKFDPPVCVQRYTAVIRALEVPQWTPYIKKVVEFGCSNMNFLVYLKTLPVEHIIEVDIDEKTLEYNIDKASPMLIDYLKRNDWPLTIDIYRGSICMPHECLIGTDVVIGIEIIEHLYPNTLEDIPFNVFGYTKPKLAIFTTPNVEFNVLFSERKFANGFRHEDHKFEWSREQFQDWAQNICDRYPDYLVEFYAIGPGPDGYEHLGGVTQMAIFARIDFLEMTETISNKNLVKHGFDELNSSNSATLITSLNYPQDIWHNIKSIIYPTNEGLTIVNRIIEELYKLIREETEDDSDYIQIPFDRFHERVKHIEKNRKKLRKMLKAKGYPVNKKNEIIIDYRNGTDEESNNSTNEGNESEIQHNSKEEEEENWESTLS